MLKSGSDLDSVGLIYQDLCTVGELLHLATRLVSPPVTGELRNLVGMGKPFFTFLFCCPFDKSASFGLIYEKLNTV